MQNTKYIFYADSNLHLLTEKFMLILFKKSENKIHTLIYVKNKIIVEIILERYYCLYFYF